MNYIISIPETWSVKTVNWLLHKLSVIKFQTAQKKRVHCLNPYIFKISAGRATGTGMVILHGDHFIQKNFAKLSTCKEPSAKIAAKEKSVAAISFTFFSFSCTKLLSPPLSGCPHVMTVWSVLIAANAPKEPTIRSTSSSWCSTAEQSPPHSTIPQLRTRPSIKMAAKEPVSLQVTMMTHYLLVSYLSEHYDFHIPPGKDRWRDSHI